MLTSYRLDILYQNTYLYLLEPLGKLTKQKSHIDLLILFCHHAKLQEINHYHGSQIMNGMQQASHIQSCIHYILERKPYKKQTKWGRPFLNLSSRNSRFHCKTFSVRNKRFLFCNVNRRNVLNKPQYCGVASISNSQFCSMPWLLGCFQSTQYSNIVSTRASRIFMSMFSFRFTLILSSQNGCLTKIKPVGVLSLGLHFFLKCIPSYLKVHIFLTLSLSPFK